MRDKKKCATCRWRARAVVYGEYYCNNIRSSHGAFMIDDEDSCEKWEACELNHKNNINFSPDIKRAV